MGASRSLFIVSFAAAAAGAGGCVASADAAAPAPPGARTVLLELFTSQGCSSCPAADAFVAELPALGLDRARVVPLAFHVDYWDDLGWKDPFATPAFSARQRRYAAAGGLRAPDGEEGIRGAYTPQMILDGAVHFSGRRRELALAEIRRAGAAPPVAELAARAALDGDRATVTVDVTARAGAAAGRERWRLLVALAQKGARTRVTRGENAGELLGEAAIVRQLSEPAPVTLPAKAAPPVTVSVTLTKPTDRPWSDVELTAFLQAEPTLRIGAACPVPIPSPR